MKRLMISIFILSLMAVPGLAQDEGYYGDEYYETTDNGYYDNTYNNDYYDYEYGYDSARPYLEGYYGPVYYWPHPNDDVYFVLIGRRIFIIPIIELRHLWHSLRWHLLSMSRFISMSCFGLSYYDNYWRFNFYSDHYRQHRYDHRYNHTLRLNFRNLFRNRQHNRGYNRSGGNIIKKRGNFNSGINRNRYNAYGNNTGFLGNNNRIYKNRNINPNNRNRITGNYKVKSSRSGGLFTSRIKERNNPNIFRGLSNNRNNRSVTSSGKSTFKSGRLSSRSVSRGFSKSSSVNRGTGRGFSGRGVAAKRNR